MRGRPSWPLHRDPQWSIVLAVFGYEFGTRPRVQSSYETEEPWSAMGKTKTGPQGLLVCLTDRGPPKTCTGPHSTRWPPALVHGVSGMNLYMYMYVARGSFWILITSAFNHVALI
jgi:hypothetical protein